MSALLRTLFTPSGNRHKKLCEDQGARGDELLHTDGETFCCKYLGRSLVADPKGEQGTAQAISHIIARAKQSGQKPSKVMLHVSLEGISVHYAEDNSLMLNTSIYKISYCSADAHYDHVFAFIATNEEESLECYAFLCAKRKIAQDVTLAIAKSFNLAYECWKNKIKIPDSSDNEEEAKNSTRRKSSTNSLQSCSAAWPETNGLSSPLHQSEFGSSEFGSSGYSSATPRPLIDLEDSGKEDSPQYFKNVQKKWAQFDDIADFEDMFSKFELNSSGTSCDNLNVFQLGNNSTKQNGTINDLLTDDLTPTNGLSIQNPIQVQSTKTSTESNSCWDSTTSANDNSKWEPFSTSPNSSFLNGCQSPTFQHGSKFEFSTNNDFSVFDQLSKPQSNTKTSSQENPSFLNFGNMGASPSSSNSSIASTPQSSKLGLNLSNGLNTQMNTSLNNSVLNGAIVPNNFSTPNVTPSNSMSSTILSSKNPTPVTSPLNPFANGFSSDDLKCFDDLSSFKTKKSTWQNFNDEGNNASGNACASSQLMWSSNLDSKGSNIICS